MLIFIILLVVAHACKQICYTHRYSLYTYTNLDTKSFIAERKSNSGLYKFYMWVKC